MHETAVTLVSLHDEGHAQIECHTKDMHHGSKDECELQSDANETNTSSVQACVGGQIPLAEVRRYRRGRRRVLLMLRETWEEEWIHQRSSDALLINCSEHQ